MSYRITVAFAKDDKSDRMPWVVEAYDEYTEENWDGTPEWFVDAVNKTKDDGFEVREMEIRVPDDEVKNLFAKPVVQGQVGSS